jgi:hypothetical protein
MRLCIWFYVCVYVLSLDRPGLQMHLKGGGARVIVCVCVRVFVSGFRYTLRGGIVCHRVCVCVCVCLCVRVCSVCVYLCLHVFLCA